MQLQFISYLPVKLNMEDKILHTVLFISLLIAVIIAFFIISIIRYHRRYISLQRERIRAEIMMQESERKRIANDLHDSLGPLLSAVKLNIQSIDIQESEDSQIIHKAGQHIDEIIKSLREISYNLMPNTLNRKGLTDAIEEYLYRCSSTHGLKIKFQGPGLEKITTENEVHLFRIIQETVHNAVKHAKATFLQIYTMEKPEELVLYIKDNGIGFELEDVQKSSAGLGLKSMESRCELIGASCKIQTSRNRGCEIIIKIPVN